MAFDWLLRSGFKAHLYRVLPDCIECDILRYGIAVLSEHPVRLGGIGGIRPAQESAEAFVIRKIVFRLVLHRKMRKHQHIRYFLTTARIEGYFQPV